MKKDKLIRLLIGLQIVILPFLDMLRTTNFRKIEVFGIAIIELINIILIGSSFLLTIPKALKNKKKHIVILGIYLALFFGYLYMHCNHIQGFNTSIYSSFSYNFLVEVFYICRVYLLPIIFLWTLLVNNDILDKHFYMDKIKIVICTICFSIIILDFFKISYISYNENGIFVSHNFIDYFLYNGDWKMLSARGWFDSANELSAIMLMLLPINIYILFKNHSKFHYVMFISQLLTMILLCTRTASIGAILICVVIAISYIVITLLKKFKIEKDFCINYILISAIFTAYMLISPFMFGLIADNNVTFSKNNSSIYEGLSNLNFSETSKEELDKINEAFSEEYRVNRTFLELYPIANDLEFWKTIANRDKAINNNSRVIKKDIIERIKERNNNKDDNYYGLGYSLNFIDLERDYVNQYYLFGIFGVLLFIAPYFILIMVAVYYFLKKLKNNLKILTIVSFIMPLLGLVIAYFSGHVFGWVSPMLFLSFCVSFLMYNVSVRRNKNE